MVNELENLMSVSELADYLHISRATINRKLASGELKSIKCGVRTLFKQSHIQEYVDGLEEGEYVGNQNHKSKGD